MNSAEIMQLSKDIYDERRSYTKPILPIGYAGLVQKLINKEITLKEMNQEYQKWLRSIPIGSVHCSATLSTSRTTSASAEGMTRL